MVMMIECEGCGTTEGPGQVVRLPGGYRAYLCLECFNRSVENDLHRRDTREDAKLGAETRYVLNSDSPSWSRLKSIEKDKWDLKKRMYQRSKEFVQELRREHGLEEDLSAR